MAAFVADLGGVQDSGTAQADAWARWYERYLTRIAGHSARSLQLYQEVLARVATGEFTANVLQEEFPAFVEANGARFGRQFADMSMGFVNELLRSAGVSSRELGEALTPEVQLPVNAPIPTASDPARWYQEVTEYLGQLGNYATKSYQVFLDRVAAGGISPAQAQSTTSSYLEGRFKDHLSSTSEQYLAFLDRMADLRGSYEEAFLSHVLARSAAGREQDFELVLSSEPGGTASASFSISNTKDESAVVQCSVTEVRRADGVGPAFRPGVSVAPTGVELEPGADARLTLSLHLDEADFAPGRPYVGAVVVRGHGEEGLEVPLRIQSFLQGQGTGASSAGAASNPNGVGQGPGS